MTAPIFPYAPNHPVSGETKPRLRQTRYGEGYAEEAPDGLNHLPTTFTLQFSDRFGGADERIGPRYREKEDILEFLSERGGYQPFYFAFRSTPDVYLVKCRQWSSATQPGDLWTISATFEQDFSEPNAYDYIYSAYPGGPVRALQAMVDFVTGPAGREAS